MATPVGAIVDDSSSAIRYSEGWLANTSVSVGPNGQIPLHNSLHITQSNSDLSFSFNGTFVSVVGSMLPTSMPRWGCFIDGIKLLSLSFTDGQEHLPLCSQSLGDGYHTITVVANATQDSPFWFDYIQYRPSSIENIDDEDEVFNTEAADVMVGSWSPISTPSGSGIMTRENNAKIQFEFNGVSLTWLGIYNNNFSGPSTTASYTLNGSDPITFPVNNFASKSTPFMFDQIILQTANYPRGLHNLEITYEGDSHTAPLTLTNFIVQNVTFSGSTSSNSSSSSTSATPSTTVPPTIYRSGPPSHSSASIAGAVIGGILLLLIICSLCFILWRRRNSNYRVELRDSAENVHPFNGLQHPTSENTLSTPVPANSKAVRLTVQIPSSELRNSVLSGKTQRMNGTINAISHLPITLSTPSGPTASSVSAASSNRSPEIRMHEDSGLRLPQPDHADTIDIPPVYSPV